MNFKKKKKKIQNFQIKNKIKKKLPVGGRRRGWVRGRGSGLESVIFFTKNLNLLFFSGRGVTRVSEFSLQRIQI